jgi:hypothetical protein
VSEVPRVSTPLTELELCDAIYVGHYTVFNTPPSSERLLVALAQMALELERGKAVWNFNIGNVTAGSSWPGDFYVLHVPPPDPPILHFRAHANALEGAIDYWTLMNKLWSSVLPFMDRGDPAGAAEQLGRLKYFLANVEVYAGGMVSLYDEYKRRGLDQAEIQHHDEVPSPAELAEGGRLWRLADELNQGVTEDDLAKVENS